MNALQVEALSRAKRGDWRLADAMELDHRASEEHVDRPPLSYGVLENGRLRALVYSGSGQAECDECDGSGESDCIECGKPDECVICDGMGTVDVEDETHGVEVITNLDGEVLEEAPGQCFELSEARQYLKQYHEAAAMAPKQSPAKPVRNASQITLIPESIQCA